LSNPTVRDDNQPVDETRSCFVAARTERDDAPRRSDAVSTVRDPHAVSLPRQAGWIATPTRRDADGGAVRDADIPQELQKQYDVQELLARGAEAELWRARRRADGLSCVLKVYFHGIRPDPMALSTVAGKPVEHFPALYEHGEACGRYFEVMEYIPNGSLRDQIRFGPIDPPSGRFLARELCEALDSLHARDTTHQLASAHAGPGGENRHRFSPAYQ